jgi:hypothetical protein
MNKTELIVFLVAFILPILYQRGHFFWRAADFKITPLRTLTGLQIHHGHWGILWIFVSSLLMAFTLRNFWTIGLLGLGWGMVIDEIIPHLKMPTEGRDLELDIYKKTARPTFILAGSIMLLIAIIAISLLSFV